MKLSIRRLTPADAAAYQALRLQGLRDSPSAFTAVYEEECATPLASVAQRLAEQPNRQVFGGFDGEQLVAIARVERDSGAKQRHRAHIRGVYVAADRRGQGAARQLMQHAIAHARTLDGVSHLNLAVTAGNAAAQALYAALGFQAWGCEPAALVVDGVAYDEIPMVKRL